LKNYPLKILLL